MDERFENPSDEAGDGDNSDASTEEETSETSSESDGEVSQTAVTTEEQPGRRGTAGTTASESSASDADETDDEPLNIRQDWDSSTIYVEPEQSEDIEVTFTRLKKQLKREDIVLEKNKHFYRGIFEIAFGEHREETKEQIRELAKQDVDQ
ncbi:hypothetical protein SAMN04487967_3681 [Natronorubrum sediminis]|uniref:DUF8160 domain-containing protein n=1 Tax=Natronorubrum sediminis TaxID=640943 RepID=A0A1H6G735_9EURY|nr:hypothetical protein [Natronorubrum sediminis]SEH18143.1 hypothetical protein SAMN04487967_3681 [Natronorubrum sediminis]